MAAFAEAAGLGSRHTGFDLFRADLDHVVLNEERSALVISSWRPGRGLVHASR